MLELPKLPKKSKLHSLAVLTSGGDAPGMNAAIRSVVRYGISQGCDVYGIQKGYSGLLAGLLEKFSPSSVANIIQRGGTILKTDRCEAFHRKDVRREAANILRRKGMDALVVIGGDGSFTGAHYLEKENHFPTIGVPGTIDNDINGTDDTIGFDTAVNTAIEAIDRIRDTASSHDRIFLVEVMGRSSGFIALQVGMGGGAETIIIPGETHASAVERLCKTVDRGIQRGKASSIIVVAEGPEPGLSSRIARDLDKRGYQAKVCILGHTQRGGTPTAHDRFLASSLGAAAVKYLLAGYSDAMVGVKNDEIVLVPFKKVVSHVKRLSKETLQLASILAS